MTAYVETLTSVMANVTTDFNQAQNTVLQTFLATKAFTVRRYGCVAGAAQGLLAAMRLKLRKTPVLTGTAADVTGTILVGAVKARGFGIVKTLGRDAAAVVFLPGDTLTVCVEVAAGGASTGGVWVEVVPLTWQTAQIGLPTATYYTESA